MIRLLGDELKASILSLCRRFAEAHGVKAACVYGAWACGYADEKDDVNVLLVAHGYTPILGLRTLPLNGVRVSLLVVDQEAFKRDVEAGWLGEFAADKLMTPYEPLINEAFLRRCEVKVKKRIVFELLENLVSEFPELSRELYIKPEYFMYEEMARRARLLPPIAYHFLNLLRGDLGKRNRRMIMDGYLKALQRLEGEGWVTLTEGFVRVTPNLIEAVKRRRLRIPPFLKSMQRAAFLHLFSVFPEVMSSLIRDEEIFLKTHRAKVADPTALLEDPEKYLLIPTPLGLIPFSDKTSIEDFVRRSVPGGRSLQMRLEELGGVLNLVYLLTIRMDHEERRVVVKKFKDWMGFKWFPLALWTLGTQSFAVLGKSRLEREYSINQLLSSHGIRVPKILYISLKERLIFEEFIEGETLLKVVQRVISGQSSHDRDIRLIKAAGERVAAVHRLGVTLGDCKPENLLITEDGEIAFLDLEQAVRGGNPAWDVAEFLYYSGHYLPPLSPTEPIKAVTKAFIEGYLEGGGRREVVREAASAKYVKVFSPFTLPHVLLAISNLCRRLGGDSP